jgi:hypothetical protein
MIKRDNEFKDLDTAFFPVAEQPVFTQDNRRIPGYKSIVNLETMRVISVVSEQYYLIRNIDAYQMAESIVQEAFDGKTLQDFKCRNILMPQSKGSCRIDLIIPNNFCTLFGSSKESWTPFVRISNSYNKTFTLKYEIGFCRWICLNGVIVGQTGVSFSATHTKRISKWDIVTTLRKRTRENMGNVGSLWRTFEQKMNMLWNIQMNPSDAMTLYCKVFDIKTPKEEISEQQKEWLFLRAKQIDHLRAEYFNELGDNAYAMLNVLTDFASFPEWTRNPSNYVDGYQRRVGRWVDEIIVANSHGKSWREAYIDDNSQNSAAFLESLIVERK